MNDVMRRAAAFLALVLAAVPAAAAIRGRIVGGGRAVAGAKIAAYDAEPYTAGLARVLANRKRVPRATATSAADGSFTLPLDGNGAAVVVVEAPHFARSVTEEIVGDDDVLIGLRPSRPRQYTVRSPDGPLAGARVIALLNDFDVEATSDAQGRFTLDLPADTTVLVVHPGIALHMLMADPFTGVITARRAVPLHGKVVDGNGVAVGGARIAIDMIPSAISAADGSFTAAAAPADPAAIEADAGGLGAYLETAPRLTIRLVPRTKISGVVRDGERRPLRGITVTAATAGREGLPTLAVTDEKGAYAVDVVPGSCVVSAMSARYRVSEQIVDARKPATHDLVAVPVPMLAGIVRQEADGKPVAGAQIMLAYDHAQEPSPYNQVALYEASPATTSGPDGRFRIAPVVVDGPYFAVAYKRGLAPGQSAAIRSGTQPGNVSIAMSAGREAGGTVRDAAGNPLAGVAVTAQRNGEMILGSLDEPILTDDAGHFTAAVGPGNWRLTFAKKGYLRESARVDANGNAGALAVKLMPEVAVRGRIVRKDGSGVEGAAVFLMSLPREIFTAADGSFTLPNLPAGENQLNYRLPNGFGGQRRVVAPADDVRIVLDDTGNVRGRVVDESGAPVTTAAVAVRRGEETLDPQNVSDPDGRFVRQDVPVGEVEVEASAKGFLAAAAHVTVAAGKTADDVVLTLRRGRVVRGKVTSADGQPVGGVSVGVNGTHDTMTEADGTYEIGGLTNVANFVMFWKSGFMSESRRLPDGDADGRIDVQLRPGITITGHVLAPNGGPLAGATVDAEAVSSNMFVPLYAETKDDGTFRIEGLGAERYNVAAHAGHFGDHDPDAPEGKAEDVDVERVRDITIQTKVNEYGAVYGRIIGVDPAAKRIDVGANNDERSEAGRVEADGSYRIDHAPVGEITVTARMGDGTSIRSAKPVVVQLAPHGEVRADLRFDERFAISGRVRRGGAPMPGARIRFANQIDSYDANSGDDGAYRVDLPAGHYKIEVGSYAVERDVVGPGTLDVDVDLTAVTVTVIDAESGTPIEKATVSARDSSTSTHAVATATTGAGGVASIDIPPRVTDIDVAKDGYATAVAAAGPSSLVVKLTRGDGVLVRLIDARDGRPLSGYAIARDAGGRVVASANEAAPDGSIRFPLPPGRYRFSASANSYGSQTVAGEVPGPDVRIAMPRGGKLLLTSSADVHADARLLGPGGEEYVRCWCNGMAEIRIDGRRTLIDSIAPGAYTLEIRQAGAKLRLIPVSVIADETTAVPLD